MKSVFKTASWLVVTLPLLTGTAVLAAEPMKPAPATEQMQTPLPQMQAVLNAHAALKPKPPHTLTPAEARKQPTAKDAVAKVLKDEHKPTSPEMIGKVSNMNIP